MDQPREQVLELVSEEREKDDEFLSSIMGSLRFDGIIPFMHEPVLTTPLLEVSSVSINSNHEIFDDGKTIEIYGTVRVTDGKGATFFPYNRDVDKAEIFSMNKSLSFTDQNCNVFTPAGTVVIRMDLRDKVRDIVIIKEEFHLDYEDEKDYDKDKLEVFQGQFGSVALSYKTHRFAVLANLGIGFGNEDDAFAYGTIKAHFVRKCEDRLSFDNSDKIRASITLFENRDQDNPIRVKPLSDFELWRSVLVVPAYCILLLEVDLHMRFSRVDSDDDCWQNFKGNCAYKPSWPGRFTGLVFTDAGDGGSATVDVVWSNGDRQLGWDRKLRHMMILEEREEVDSGEREEINNAIEELQIMPLTKKPRLLSSELPSVSLADTCSTSSASPLMEVFSVFIGSQYNDDPDPASISGVVEVFDEIGMCNIFGKGKQHAELLSPLTSKGLAFQLCPDRIINGPRLRMATNLRDGDGSIISKGRLAYDEPNFKRAVSPYDRLLCSVFRGARGYAAVHHMIFSSGVQAKLKITCSPNDSSSATVLPAGYLYGRISAWYSSYEYSTCYESEFYKLKLFQIDDVSHALLVESGSEMELPLCRSLVAVPHPSALVIGVDLHSVRLPVPDHQNIQALKKDLVVNSCVSGELSKVILGEYYRLNVSVKWSVVK